MALSDIIDTIHSRTILLEICDSLPDVLVATTEDELIIAGKPFTLWAYQSGVVDDALLGDFTEATLNTYEIYTTGTYALTDPDPAIEIFIMKDAVVTIDITDRNKRKINVMGAPTVTINIGNSSYTTINGYNTSALTILIQDTAIVRMETKEEANALITMEDTSVLHVFANAKSTIDVTLSNDSYVNAKLYHNSKLTYLLNDSAVIDGLTYQQAQLINSAP